MSLSEKRSHDQFQKNEINQFQSGAVFKVERYQTEISNIALSKQSTSIQDRKQSSDQQILKRINSDESEITNIYDLEQLNYKVFMNKEFERSVRIQQKLMKMVDRNPEYYHQHSLTYLALNDIDNAQKWYDEAISISPYFYRYYSDYGINHKNSEEIAEYVPKLFIDSIKYIQNNIDCYKEQQNQLIAECLFAYNVCLSKRPQKALKMLMMLIKRYPKCYLPYFYLSKCYYHIEDFYQGLQHINQAIMCFRYKDIQLYNLKGKILIQIGDLEDAIRVYSLFPNNQYFQSELQQIKIKIYMKSVQQELKIQNIIIQQPEKIEKEYEDKGICYYKERKYEQATESLLYALELNPNNGLCQFMIAKCYLKLGDFDCAQEHSNIAASFYDDAQRLVKILNKIDNERNRSEIKTYKGYQSRMFK